MTWFIKCPEHGLVCGIIWHWIPCNQPGGGVHSTLSKNDDPGKLPNGGFSFETLFAVEQHRTAHQCTATLGWEWVEP